MTDLSQLIRPELVMINPSHRSSTEVIQALGSLLIEGGYGKESLVSAALKREALYPTGLLLDASGVNAAIPHADREHINLPAAAVAVLGEPVLFHQMDDPDIEIPVRLVFLLALPDAESQLQTLRSLGATLQNPEIISRLVASETPEQLISTLSTQGAAA